MPAAVSTACSAMPPQARPASASLRVERERSAPPATPTFAEGVRDHAGESSAGTTRSAATSADRRDGARDGQDTAGNDATNGRGEPRRPPCGQKRVRERATPVPGQRSCSRSGAGSSDRQHARAQRSACGVHVPARASSKAIRLRLAVSADRSAQPPDRSHCYRQNANGPGGWARCVRLYGGASGCRCRCRRCFRCRVLRQRHATPGRPPRPTLSPCCSLQNHRQPCATAAAPGRRGSRATDGSPSET